MTSQININTNINMIKLIIITLLFTTNVNVLADKKFQSNYLCVDTKKHCVSSGERIVEGVRVTRDCWEWSYTKTCNYPSKNDCRKYAHCYAVKELPCLLYDSYGNCVNVQKEFSCKSWKPVIRNEEKLRTDLVEKEGAEQLVCKGIPCLDGNCLDKSYMTDGDMMDSISKLYAVSQAKGATDLNFELFKGFAKHCSKKALHYTNCCSTKLRGWGKHLGARCSKDEIDLIDKRNKNLCIYLGKTKSKTLGATIIVKHKYCCFGSLLNKVIQAQGRKQLGIGWGSPSNPNCRGLTLSEIMQLNFDEMDFSEFFIEIKKRMKLPKVGDIKSRIKTAMPNVQKYDNNPYNKKNKYTGINNQHNRGNND